MRDSRKATAASPSWDTTSCAESSAWDLQVASEVSTSSLLRYGLFCSRTTQEANSVKGLIPSSRADTVINYDQRCYSGQFSDDGNFFFSCSQDFQVRMYDTSNPYDWKYYKTVDFPFGQWTITDATLSPDNRFLAYSSIRHTVCLAPTDPNDHNDHGLLDFTNYAPGAQMSDRSTAISYRSRLPSAQSSKVPFTSRSLRSAIAATSATSR